MLSVYHKRSPSEWKEDWIEDRKRGHKAEANDLDMGKQANILDKQANTLDKDKW